MVAKAGDGVNPSQHFLSLVSFLRFGPGQLIHLIDHLPGYQFPVLAGYNAQSQRGNW